MAVFIWQSSLSSFYGSYNVDEYESGSSALENSHFTEVLIQSGEDHLRCCNMPVLTRENCCCNSGKIKLQDYSFLI